MVKGDASAKPARGGDSTAGETTSERVPLTEVAEQPGVSCRGAPPPGSVSDGPRRTPRTAGRREVDRALDEYRAEQAIVLENVRVAIARVSNGHFVWVNRRMEVLTGYSADELIGMSPEALCAHDTDDGKGMLGERPAMAEGDAFVTQCRMRCKDGSLVWAELSENAIGGTDDSSGAIWILRDITRQKDVEKRLHLGPAIFDNTTEGILVSDAEDRIVMVNPAFTAITGYGADEVVGNKRDFLYSTRHDPAFAAAIRHRLEQTGRWEGEVWNCRKNGEEFPEWVSVTAVSGEHGEGDSYVSVFSDITRRKQDEERIRHQAYYDALTDLPNRRLVEDRVTQVLALAADSEEKVGILYLDLDNFRFVNDHLGQGVGDALLVEMARRMRSCLRDRDSIGRIGGDRFLVFLPIATTVEEASMVARRLLEAVSRPVLIKGREDDMVLTTSIGIAVYPDDGLSAADLTSNAEAAARHAKDRGRNTYQFFTHDMNIQVMGRLTLENRLRRALDRGELILHYQPKIELRSGHIVGAEALVRWQVPGEGLVPPERFIAVAEASGLIVPLGEWVLRTACAQGKAWQDAGLRPIRIAVNLSARQLSKKDLIADVTRILDETGFAPEHLEMEITESSLMDRAEDAIATLKSMRAMGIYLTADDFGTGYSSLNYLKNFPLDAIKIDTSFVADIGREGGGAMLAGAVIAIGQSLGLKVIAEGVENETQLSFLRQQWCDEIQGFYYSRPVPAEDFAELLSQDRRL